MSNMLTIEEINSRYVDEWVLVGDPVVEENLQVLRGTVLWHSKDRDELYRKALELQPQSSAVLYTGHTPQGAAIIL
jgi:hypothetical protein